MGIVTVYSEPIRRRYLAHRWSLAWFSQACLIIIIILCPFFLGLTTRNFWVREKEFREQPDVGLRGQVLAFTQGTLGQGKIYSTSAVANRNLGSAMGVMTIGELAVDENGDGKPERFEFSVDVPLAEGEVVHGLTVIAMLRYNLTDVFSLMTDAMVAYSIESARPGASLFVRGNLQLDQKVTYAYASMHIFANSFLNDTRLKEIAAPDFLENLYTDYAARDIRPHFTPGPAVWTSGAGRSFKARIIVDVPVERILYAPGFWETMKFAWVQYIALFTIFWFFIHWLRMYIFRYQVVETRVLQESIPKVKPF